MDEGADEFVVDDEEDVGFSHAENRRQNVASSARAQDLADIGMSADFTGIGYIINTPARRSVPAAHLPSIAGQSFDAAVSTSTPFGVISTVSSLLAPTIDGFHAKA